MSVTRPLPCMQCGRQRQTKLRYGKVWQLPYQSINHFCGRLGLAIDNKYACVFIIYGLAKMQRRLPQFWSNTTNSTGATNYSGDKIRVRNHHDQPH